MAAETRAAAMALGASPVAMELVCERLDAYAKLQLRLVCRSFREATRNCFTVAVLSPRKPALQHDILELFPRIKSLHVVCVDNDDDSKLQGAIDTLATASPNLLGKVQTCHLRLTTGSWNAVAVQALASRCTSLELFTLVLPVLEATFRGAGPTASERCAHLQRMLAMPSPTPTLLYPPSWAACHCLQQLRLDLPDRFRLHTPPSVIQPLNRSSSRPYSMHLTCALAHLTAVTQLTVFFDDHNREYELVLEALPALQQLRHLELIFPNPEQGLTPDAPWANLSGLTSLTHLQLPQVYVDLAALTSLHNLRHLDIDYWDGSTADLYSFTALTCLSLGCLDDLGGLNHEESPLTRDMPVAWCTSLKHLGWLYNSNVEPAALGMLSALSSLEINYQEFTLDFVRALAELPLLQELEVFDMTPHATLSSSPTPPPVAERPVFKSLRQITDRYGEMAFINVLASWTALPAGGHSMGMLVGGAFQPHPVALVQHWSPCWLRALLRIDDGSRQQLLFLTEQDVAAFCAAADGLAGPITVNLELHVAPQLPAAAFQQLVLTAGRLSKRTWQLTGWGKRSGLNNAPRLPSGVPDLSYVGVGEMPAQGLRLTAAHVRGLPANSLANLTEVYVGRQRVSAAAKRGLLVAAPGVDIIKGDSSSQLL